MILNLVAWETGILVWLLPVMGKAFGRADLMEVGRKDEDACFGHIDVGMCILYSEGDSE